MRIQLFTLLCLGVLLTGCGHYNPCAPDLRGQHVDGPPVLYLSFDDTIKNLVEPTWASVLTWWNDNGATWNGYGPGWGNADPGSTDDNAHNLAYNFWKSKGGDKKVGVGGICGNFAGFMIYACRMHGYKTGGACYYSGDDRGSCTGHIEAWVVDYDGKVLTTSNAIPSHMKSYNSLKEMKDDYDRMHNYKNEHTWGYVQYMNDHCVYMSKEEMLANFGVEK